MTALLLIVWTALATPQQSDPVIEWLTSLQIMQTSLRSSGTPAVVQIADELRVLRTEIAGWASSQTDDIAIPEMPAQQLQRRWGTTSREFDLSWSSTSAGSREVRSTRAESR